MEDHDNPLRDRTVVWNPHTHDGVGVVWCIVTEDKPGYKPMKGRGPSEPGGLGTSPWYLARLDNHTDENGKVDYPALWEDAERTAEAANREAGYTPKETRAIINSAFAGPIPAYLLAPTWPKD